MSAIADDMLNGWQCSLCGVCFEEEHGYPVVCRSCWNDSAHVPQMFEGQVFAMMTPEGFQQATYKELGDA